MSRLAIALAVSIGAAATAAAEQVTFRYIPVDPCGKLAQTPAGPGGALGEKLTGFGLRPQPFEKNFRPNQVVTFRHPYHGRNVTVPLTLPAGTPRIEHRGDRIIYNYGSYVTEVRFFPDGSVDVVYNSGFLRPLAVE